MKISILGCGWLGFPLAKSLVAAGHSVAGSTTQQEKLKTLLAEGIAPYLIRFDPQPVGENLSDFFDTDILIIAIPPKRKSAGTDYYLNQLHEIINNAQKTKTRSIILISSTSVYPESNTVVVETDAMSDSYGVQAENIIMTSPLKSTVLRFGGLFGPGRNPGRFLSEKTNIGGAENPVNLIHLTDCIGIIQKVIEKNIWGEIFNACAGSHPTRKEFYSRMAILSGMPTPEFASADQKSFKIVNAEKLVQRLDYQFQVDDLMAWVP